ncbi:MAG: hypothetical protein M0Z52_11080 [Actinomycetota bacterium]|nr:hypothetical protein [Actinomycetota bacterium]
MREILIIVKGVFPDMIESLDCLREGARSGVYGPLESAVARCRNIRVSEKALASMAGYARAVPAAADFASIPGHIGRISGYLQVIANAIAVKNRENILFSEKAMDEIDLLFARLRELMEMALTAVCGVSGEVAGGISGVERAAAVLDASAGEFLVFHEERLLEGLCLPKASSLYVEMVDGFKAISWHLKEMARKAAGV